MKAKSLMNIVMSVVLPIISVGCSTNISSPTVTPIPSKTALPTSTPTPILTSTPTMTATETLTPIVEKDLQSAFIETIAQTYMDVQINMSIITDASMDSFNPPIHKIYINPHFNNYDGENAKVALAHVVALTFYKLWRSRQNPPPPASDADFKAYLQLWSEAQKSNDPSDWAKVQIEGVWANDLNDGNGYKQQEYIVWPVYTGPIEVHQGVQAITEVSIAIGRSSKMKNITRTSEGNFGLGTNLDGNKLYVYRAWGSNPNKGQHTAGWQFTSSLVSAMMWLIHNQGGSGIPDRPFDKELYKIINRSNNPGNCCYQTALKIDPPTQYENTYNP